MVKIITIHTRIFSIVGVKKRVKGTMRASLCTAEKLAKSREKKKNNTSSVLRDLHSFAVYFFSLTKGTF